jgi:hypothetical protein
MIEGVFVAGPYVDPLMPPYLVRPIGSCAVSPERAACEIGRLERDDRRTVCCRILRGVARTLRGARKVAERRPGLRSTELSPQPTGYLGRGLMRAAALTGRARRCTCRHRKQPTVWSLTSPAACMKA